MMVERNRHPAGRLWNIAFGLCAIADGVVRVLSFGWLHTRLLTFVTKQQAKSLILRRKNVGS